MSHVAIEFAGRLCIFLTRSFKAKGMNRTLTISWDTLGKCIRGHTSANSLKTSKFLHHERIWKVLWYIKVNTQIAHPLRVFGVKMDLWALGRRKFGLYLLEEKKAEIMHFSSRDVSA